MGAIKDWMIELSENHLEVEDFIQEYGGPDVMRAFDEAILAQDIGRMINSLKDALGMCRTTTHRGYAVVSKLAKENPHGGPPGIYTC